jgi:hypothetical protein
MIKIDAGCWMLVKTEGILLRPLGYAGQAEYGI